MTVMLVAPICAFDLAIAAYGTIEARIIAKELIPVAFFGCTPIDGYEWRDISIYIECVCVCDD